MSVELASIQLDTPEDSLLALRQWIRRERHRMGLTQADLSRKSGVPSATISRLELTGLASTDVVFRILFALEKLDSVQAFLAERLRLASFPLHLNEPEPAREIQRVRHRKEA